jgi:hypothetical protein
VRTADKAGRVENKRVIVAALRSLLYPLVRLLLKVGVSSRDFGEIAKSVYVEAATAEFGLRGRAANVSRVAVLTGLTRREVARLRRVIDIDPTILDDRAGVLARVLSGWHQDAEFIDAQGRPRALPMSGAASLSTLLNRYCGDLPITAVITELEHVGAVKRAGGYATVKSRYYMPMTLDADALARFGSVVHDLLTTIGHNLVTAPEAALFEGRATNDRIPAAQLDAFRAFLNERGQAFLEDVDDWLTQHTEPNGQETIRLGTGLYLISGDHGNPGSTPR